MLIPLDLTGPGLVWWAVPFDAAPDLYLRWIEELWNWSEPDAADLLVAEDFVGHWPDRDVHGRAELVALISETRAMVTDLRFAVEVGPIIDGDLVAGRWTGKGLLEGKETSFFGNDILRVRNGQFVEYWPASSSGS